jgi:ubiquinone/menaquinone biosynthesis C-methylase UbiE
MTQEEINKRFNEFREWCKSHVYSEPDTQLHINLMDNIIPKVVKDTELSNQQSILDVGCGQGYGMVKFKELGCDNIQGITLSSEDVQASQARGFTCTQQDMSFTDFNDSSFDFLFVRHALEHSPYPLLTLKEFNRILSSGGGAYIEMPSPKCDRKLEEYDNHYSIMGSRQWIELMKRAGFSIADSGELKFKITAPAVNGSTWEGTEVYEYYLIKKN